MYMQIRSIAIGIPSGKEPPYLLDMATSVESIRQIKRVPTASGVAEILIPGELEQRNMTARKQDGIPLGQTAAEELAKLCSAYGVDLAQAICTS
ncbi:hypothetical protein [Brevibacillus sp. SAFN-007a]|uniref:hypothetical protein n=1 Tax=Brevibacillus sp. SAFN-007a TaxID=3436862 RepID=UPI003F7D1BF7